MSEDPRSDAAMAPKVVADAERLLRESIGHMPSGGEIPRIDVIADALRRFATVDFDVPADSDGDGFLFQYGAFRFLPEPGFHVGFVRQFDIVDSDDEHECYVQLSVDYLYPIDSELEEAGRHVDWWFKPGDEMTFDQWLDNAMADPIWALLRTKSPTSFTIAQEDV